MAEYNADYKLSSMKSLTLVRAIRSRLFFNDIFFLYTPAEQNAKERYVRH